MNFKKLVYLTLFAVMLIAGVAISIFWKDIKNASGLAKKVDYVIPGVPFPNVHNHKGEYRPLTDDINAAVFSISEYWNPGKTNPNDVVNFFKIKKGQYITGEKIKEYFDYANKNYFDVSREYLSVDELKKYINPKSKTPLMIFGQISKDQPKDAIFHPAIVLIGIKETEKKLVFHDYWLGNNYEISFDDYNAEQNKLKPGIRNSYIVIQPKKIKEKLKEISQREDNVIYPKRTQIMHKIEPMISDCLIGGGYVWGGNDIKAEEYYMKVRKSPDFVDYLPPVFKMRLYSNLADIKLRRNNLEEAVNYIKMAIDENHDLDKSLENGWPGFELTQLRDGTVVGVSAVPFKIAGDIYKKMGNFESARNSYLRALELYPSYEEAELGLLITNKNIIK